MPTGQELFQKFLNSEEGSEFKNIKPKTDIKEKSGEELYQQFLKNQKEEANLLYQQFNRDQEIPILEKESNQRIKQQLTNDPLFNYVFSPDVSKPQSTEPKLGFMDYATGMPKELGKMAMQTGIGALGGMEGYIKKTMPTGYYKEWTDLPGFAKTPSRLMGTIGRYAALGKLFAPLVPFISGLNILKDIPGATLPLIGDMSPEMIRFGLGAATSRAATWATSKLIDNASKVATDMQDPTIKNMLLEPIEAGGWGALLGMAQVVGLDMFNKGHVPISLTTEIGKEQLPNIFNIGKPSFGGIKIGIETSLGQLENTFSHFLLTGMIGGSRAAADKLTDMLTKYDDFTMDDVIDIGSAALFTGVIESIGHYQVQEAWNKAQIENWNQEKLIIKVMNTTGKSHEDAAKDVIFVQNFTNTLKANSAYVQTMSEKFVPEFERYSIDQQKALVDGISSNMKNEGMSFSNAYQSSIATVGAPKNPKVKFLSAPKEEDIGTRTAKQIKKGHAVQDRLKILGFSDEDINTLKDKKSFRTASLQDASKMIKKMESAEKLLDTLMPTANDTPEEMIEKIVKRVNAFDKKTEDLKAFKEMIEEGTPPELLKYNGQDYRQYDYVRPSRMGFRRDPYTYFNGYLPIYEGYVNSKIGFEEKAVRAIDKAKKLKLSNDELKDIAERRGLIYFQKIKMEPSVMARSLPILNDRQKEFDDFLTREYMWAHPYFNVKGFVPYEMYNPLIRESQEMETIMMGSFYPDKIPDFIDAFFMHQRESSKTEGLRTNALEDYLKYIKSGFKKKFLEGPMQDARSNVMNNPHIKASMKEALKDYATWMMGWPTALDESYNAMFKDLGLKPEDAQNITRFFTNLVYSSAISPRPILLAKQFLQNLNEANELGYSWTVTGFKDFLKNGFSEARKAGVLTEYAPETYQEYGKKYPLDRLRESLVWSFQQLDKLGRTVTYYTAKNKWDYHYSKSKNIPEFMQKVGANYLDKTERWRIKDQLRKGNIYEARRIFFKEAVANAHYKYGKEDAPIWTKKKLGKLFMQLHSWPENYGELLVKNYRNNNTAFFVRQLFAILFLTWLGEQIGQKWMKGYPVTSFPMTRYKVRQFAVPASLTGVEDLIMLAADPIYRYLQTTDPEKAKKAFKKQLDILGKDTLLYIPGGLALKDLYGIKDFIPMEPKQEYNLEDIRP